VARHIVANRSDPTSWNARAVVVGLTHVWRQGHRDWHAVTLSSISSIVSRMSIPRIDCIVHSVFPEWRTSLAAVATRDHPTEQTSTNAIAHSGQEVAVFTLVAVLTVLTGTTVLARSVAA